MMRRFQLSSVGWLAAAEREDMAWHCGYELEAKWDLHGNLVVFVKLVILVNPVIMVNTVILVITADSVDSGDSGESGDSDEFC